MHLFLMATDVTFNECFTSPDIVVLFNAHWPDTDV